MIRRLISTKKKMEFTSGIPRFFCLATLLLVFFGSVLVTSLQSIDLENPVVTITPRPLQAYISKIPKDALLCERVHVVPLSRSKLERYANSINLTVSPSVVIPEKLHNRIQICVHRNASTGLCKCEKDQWKSIQKGKWESMASPYEDKYIDVKFIGDISGTVIVSIKEEFHEWRLICLAVGVILLLAAPLVSSWVPFYYSSSMAIGIMLIIVILLFQAMKLLPTSRKNVFYLTICWSVLGVGSFLLHEFSVLVKPVLMNFGLSEEMLNPVSIFLLVGVVLAGAALGYWIVRKFVILDDGSVDVGIAQFVKWAMRIIASTFILQGTSDTAFSWATLVLCWGICSFITCSKRRKSGYSTPTWVHSPVKGLTSPTSKQRLKSSKKVYYSTFHKMPRRRMSKKEWDNLTRESTREAMTELISTPEFAEWIIEHADQIQLRSDDDDSSDESVVSGSDSIDETFTENRSSLAASLGLSQIFNW